MSNVSKPPSYSSQGLVELIHTGHSEQACSIIDDILMDKNNGIILDGKDQNSWSEDLGIQ